MKPSVLLLHSGGMSSRQWRKLGERLGGDYRVVAPDFLGSGGNPTWPEDQPFDLTMDLDVVDRLMPGPFHVVGHSYGGLIALMLARRRPTEVRSLALYDPVAFGVVHAAGDPEGLDDLARVGADPVFTDDARGGTEPWWRVFIDYWNRPGSWDNLPQPSRDSFLRVGRKVYLEVRSLMAERSGGDSYRGIQAPALLLTGEGSPPSARRVVQLLSEALPHGKRMSVPGAGHMGPITHADTVNDLIAEHLQRASFPAEEPLSGR